MKTHNINPQRGLNNPKYEQVFKSSQLASQKINYNKDHISKKPQDEYLLPEEAIEIQKNSLKLTIDEKERKLVQKLGLLKKPDLTKTKRFVADENLKKRYTSANPLEDKDKTQEMSVEDRIEEKDSKREPIKSFNHPELLYTKNPQNYAHLNSNLMKSIPFAGKSTVLLNRERYHVID